MAARDQPNIVLVVLDTVRAQQLGCYGHDTETMPNLASFAEDAVVFDRAYTNAPWTLPAHASLFTGRLPSEHGCHGGTLRFDTDQPTLASRLRESGYDSIGVSNNIWVSDHFGLDAGFDTFYKQWQLFKEARDLGHLLKSDGGLGALAGELFTGNPIVNALNGIYGKFLYRRNDFGGRRTTNDVLSLVDGTDEPFFLFANYMEAHAPYQPHEDIEYPDGLDRPLDYYEGLSNESFEYHTGEREISPEEFDGLRTLYEGELRYLDRCLGRLFDGLAQRDLLADSLVVVVGDHGENIGDHDLMAHRFSVDDTVLRVPLLVNYPEHVATTDRHTEPVDLRAVHDELCAFGTGEESESPLRSDRDRPVVAEYLDPSYTREAQDDEFPFETSRYNRRYRTVVMGEYKYVTSDRDEETVYRYRRGELEEVPPESVDIIESLRAECEEFETYEASERAQTDEEVVKQHLADLGYR